MLTLCFTVMKIKRVGGGNVLAEKMVQVLLKACEKLPLEPNMFEMYSSRSRRLPLEHGQHILEKS